MNIDLDTLVVYALVTTIIILVVSQIRGHTHRSHQQSSPPRPTKLARETADPAAKLEPVISPSTGPKNRPFLSGREWEIARLAAKGFQNKEIADQLGLSVHTVGTHMKKIYRKLDVSSRLELADKLQDLGVGDEEDAI